MIDILEVMAKMFELENKNYVTLLHTYKDRKKQENVLNSIFGDNWNKDVEIDKIDVQESGEYAFITYNTKFLEKNISTRNIIALKNDVMAFRIEELKNWNIASESFYQEKMYASYDESGKIENRIRINSWEPDLKNVIIEEVNILNKQANEYTRHNYTLCRVNDKVISFTNHNQRWQQGEESFTQRLNSIENNITSTELAINARINETLDPDKVKVYTIKRKVR